MGIHITIDDEDIAVLGVERCKAILAALKAVAEEERRLSYILAVSGAMRWPRSMRPEVLVAATCDVL
jgi:hypothetical protein